MEESGFLGGRSRGKSMEVYRAHLIGTASIMPRSVLRRKCPEKKNLAKPVAQSGGFWYADQAAKNLDLAAQWERVGVAQNVAAVL